MKTYDLDNPQRCPVTVERILRENAERRQHDAANEILRRFVTLGVATLVACVITAVIATIAGLCL